jgi:hypothetical protein
MATFPRLLLVALIAPLASAQVSEKGADLIVPIVGSTSGQVNAHFKTQLQMTNATNSIASGWLVYRPHGLLKHYDLPPRTTISFGDVVGEYLGGTGLGSLDILVDRGAPPTVVARAYDDQPTGTTGVTVPAIPSAAVLIRGDSGTLIAPHDHVRYRFNAGVRSLGSGATLELIVRAANGTERNTRVVTFGEDEFKLDTGSAFAGITLGPDDSIEVRIAAGSAIVFATAVDNQTNDSSIQVLRK